LSSAVFELETIGTMIAMTHDLKSILALARAATKGPWERGNGPYILGPATRSASMMDICTVSINSTEANASYIAAMSPDVAIQLCERLERAEAALILSMDGFEPSDFADLHKSFMETSNEKVTNALLSNNYSVILAALKRCSP
jgi:hypothetical protein